MKSEHRLKLLHTNFSEIATSSAVVELKIILLLISLLLILLNYNYIGLLVILLNETFINTSIESVISLYGSIGWIIIIEITLFCGFLITTWIILLSDLFLRHDISLFPVARTNLGHSIALIALIFWILQIISGFLLLGLLSYSLECQYVELINIVYHGNFVWLLRMLHMLGANFVIIFTIIHFSKVILYINLTSPNKSLIWLIGSAIFIIALAIAFTGYVVVAGNMSYWAALVILNLFSIIPAIGDEIVSWILGSSTVTSWSLRRFTIIHFLTAIIAIILIIIHIILLHRQSPSKINSDINDGTASLVFVLIKDLVFCLIIISLLFLDSIKSLVHPDNWQSFSRLITPSHIEPEIYFLWAFSAIKLHNGKILGALFLIYLE